MTSEWELDPACFTVDGRTIVVHLPDGDVPLTQPTGTGWRSVLDAYFVAEEKVAASEASPVRAAFSDDLPFSTAFCVLLDVASSRAPIDPGDLPMWANDRAIVMALHRVWATAMHEVDTDDFTPIPGS